MRNINFKQLEAFVAVVEQQSFTEAANRLYLAQSTVSNHIQALEQALNVTLFQRESRKHIALTPDGRRVYQYAREIMAKCAALEEDMAGEQEKELIIGASTAPAQGILPTLISGFIKERPTCCCTMKTGDSEQIHRMLLSGEIQAGFVGSSDNRQSLLYEKIAEDHLVMIAPNTPYYAQKLQAGTLGRQLLKEPLVFRESGSATQKLIDNYLSEQNISAKSLNVAAYISMPDALKELVALGTGVSIISELAVRDEAASGKLLVFPLEEQPVSRNIYMVYRKKGAMSELAQHFVRYVRHSME